LTRDDAEAIATIFQEPARRKIVRILLDKNRPLYHNEIHSILKGSKSTTHTHLAELEIKGVLLCKEGFKSSSKILVDYYWINPKFLPLLKKFEELL